jgi:SnoaL-like domain
MAAVTPIRSRSRSPPEHAAPARVCRTGIRRRYRGCMSALTEYIDAWVVGDAEHIAATVAEDCVITECYGPVYRGRDWVRRWAQEWFGAGGIVHRWEITYHLIADDREVAQWTFEYTWEGERNTFDGATVARVADDVIVELREYQTTAPLYDWHGTWR